MFLAATRPFLGMLHVLLRPPSTSFFLYLVSLSFSIHILRMESLFLALRASDRVHFFERPPARLWSFTGARLFFVSNSFNFYVIASSWRPDSILRPSERMPTILPQEHGVLATEINLGCLTRKTVKNVDNIRKTHCL